MEDPYAFDIIITKEINVSKKRNYHDNFCLLFNEIVMITNDKKCKKQKKMNNTVSSKKRKFNNI